MAVETTSRKERFAQVLVEVQEADADMTNIAVRLRTEGPSFALQQAHRDAVARWNTILAEYSELKIELKL
jgi:GrpB-like predicted nucleotidyltransferase (UPF0157 family)